MIALFSICILAIFSVSADWTIRFFKKYDQGDWIAGARSFSPEAQSAISVCLIGCLIISAGASTLSVSQIGLRDTSFASTFVLLLNFIYRMPMALSDRYARKYESKYRAKKALKIRRFYSLFFAIIALAIAALLTYHFGNFLPDIVPR